MYILSKLVGTRFHYQLQRETEPNIELGPALKHSRRTTPHPHWAEPKKINFQPAQECMRAAVMKAGKTASCVARNVFRWASNTMYMTDKFPSQGHQFWDEFLTLVKDSITVLCAERCHCALGNSDINNLRGFTSKKLLTIFLTMFVKKCFKRISHFVRICIIRFTKILCCVLNDSTIFISFFWHGYKKPRLLCWFHEAFGKSYPPKNVICQNFCQTVIMWGKILLFWSMSPIFWAFLIPIFKFAKKKCLGHIRLFWNFNAKFARNRTKFWKT